jgi:hypothetical protein
MTLIKYTIKETEIMTINYREATAVILTDAAAAVLVM